MITGGGESIPEVPLAGRGMILRFHILLVGLCFPLLMTIGVNQFADAVGEHFFSPWQWVIFHACSSALFGLAPVFAVRFALGRWSGVWQALGWVRVSWLLCVLSVALGLILILFGNGMYTLVIEQVMGPGALADNLFSQSSQTGWGFGFLLLVCAPLSEEIFFRGFLALFFDKYPWWLFVLLSSVVFALLHQESWILTLPLVWSGIIFANLRVYTRSIYPSLLVHSLYNAIPLTVVLLHVR